MNSPNWDGSKFENYEPILNIVKHSEDDEEDNGYSYKLLLPEIGELVAGYTIRQGISAMVD